MLVAALRCCLLVALCAALFACGAPTQPLAAPRDTAVAGAADVAALSSSTPGAPATGQPSVPPATPTLVPTGRPQPTQTPSPTPQPTQTPSPTPQPTASPTAEPTPEGPPALPSRPVPDISPVAGELAFARGTIEQRPWMVMIDNHPDAYPQSGLDRAAVVFEGLAEYGVTRFAALYSDGITPEAAEIGPVRSTRLYFAQWAMGFHPVYAYAGGSPDGVALAQSTDQLVSFDALNELGYVWRDRIRLAPHNLYTSSAMLRRFSDDKAVRTPDDTQNGYLFESLAAAEVPQATAIDYFFLDRSSRAGFRYDAASNGYHRIMRGTPHRDRVTEQQLWTRNVVVMQVSESARQGDPQQRIDQQVVGSGEARVFMAGRALEASWRKDADGAPLRFYDRDGRELVFNAGPLWIAAIPSFDRLTVE